MRNPTGEMPFLDHLEELRGRILRSLGAVVGGFALGLFLVDRLALVERLKGPIAPYLPDGRLTVLSPTEPFMITLKLGFLVGLVLASPVIIWQIWAFLSPALYEREKKALVPALFAGMGLFLTGAVLSFLFIVPRALGVLLSFQRDAFSPMITFEKYFSFVMQLMLALGLSFELPLLMIMLAALGVVTPAVLGRFRRYAVVLSFVAGAVLSPGGDAFSMVMLTVPLLLLYELGVAGAWVVHRRRLRRGAMEGAAALLVALAFGAGPLEAQQPAPPTPARPPIPGQAVQDTSRAAGLRRLDSASARRLGLPSGPTRQFREPDSMLQFLMQLRGFSATRYRSDSATLLVPDNVVDLRGNAMTDRDGAVLEADRIQYREGDCALEAEGEPRLFQGGQVVVGLGARYDTCEQRGVVRGGLTTLEQTGTNWFLRGNLAVDSARAGSGRYFAGSSEITSCDLPVPHYHFAAKQLKWVSRSVMVARPAVLYIRDVPVAWIPFLFQDTKPGRRSGILIPQFGFNDVVRPSRGYNRQITNIGYYWAISDYLDAQVQLDWFSNRYLQYGLSARYAVLDRFLSGGVDYSEQHESGGSTSRSITVNHQQRFDVSTTLSLNASYVTQSSVIARNSIDPRLTTQNVSSSMNFTKRYPWGSLTVGGTGRQSINDGSTSLDLPSITLSPKPIDFGRSLTWSPDLSLTNQWSLKQPLARRLLVPAADSGLDTLDLTGKSRRSQLRVGTPLRIGSFQLPLSFVIQDSDSTGREVETYRIPNDATPDPSDSLTATRFRNSGFQSSIDWATQVQLPILFRSTFKLTPFVSIQNRTAGDFAIRNAATGGRFVTQGKRLSGGVSMAPALYGFFPGVFGAERIRHSISPLVTYTIAPSATVPEEYARAIQRPGQPLRLRSDPQQQITLTLSQNFEAKSRRAPGDTLGTSQRKTRILSLTTSGIGYDIEQSKKPGMVGWTTQSLTNQVLSDLLPGFSLGLSHNLWDGPVGFRSSRFDPFLESVTANFSLTGGTFRAFGALFGLGSGRRDERPLATSSAQPVAGGVPLPGDLRRASLLTPSQTLSRGTRPFQATVALSYTRTRPQRLPDGTLAEAPPAVGNVNLSTGFSPTRFWGLSWNTSYNSERGAFEQHQISLTRDLHEWRAAFNFVKNPNGNFAFFVSVFLTDLPDIKFDYNQTTIEP